MQETDDCTVVNLVRKLDRLLVYAQKVYAAYLESGNKFCYARVLFDVNSKISDLLYDNIDMIPDDHKEHAFDLMFHIDVWKSIWIDEFDHAKPRHNERFAFPNEVTFPRQSVETLLALGRPRN